MAEDLQWCPRCNQWKSEENYHPSRWQQQGKHCKRCRRDAHIMRLYGISMDEYDRLFDFQNGCCALCDLPEKAASQGIPTRLSVDHDHETGEVRGLLCRGCNHILGAIEMKPEDWLLKTEEYLHGR